jgi:hypothetical protein
MRMSSERFMQGVIGGLLCGALLSASLSACNSAASGSKLGSVGSPRAGTGAPTAASNPMPQSGAPAAGVSSSAAGTGAVATAGKAGDGSTQSGASGSAAPLVAGTGSAGTGSAGMAIAGAAAAGSGGSAGTAGGAGASGSAGAASAPGKDCMADDVGPCGTFTTQAGVKIQLGPYGAATDLNVGAGFEVPLSSGDSDGGQTCSSVVASFGEDPAESKPLLDTTGINFALYTVYRPANWGEGETYPIITWGNGTCAKPEGYGALLRYVASQGFFVIAANSRWTANNSPMTKALDFAFAANADAKSPYYKRLDTSKVGAMGHSQGGMATISAAQDKRVLAVIIFNGGSSAVKPFLAVSGDMDIGNPAVSSLKNALTGNPPGAYLFYHKVVGTGPVRGHLTLMTQPERVVEPTTAWFKYRLQGDMNSAAWFLGDSCKLCNMSADFEYGQKGLQ